MFRRSATYLVDLVYEGFCCQLNVLPGTQHAFFSAPRNCRARRGHERNTFEWRKHGVCPTKYDILDVFRGSFRASPYPRPICCAFSSMLPRLAPACPAHYETYYVPATRAAAETKRQDRSLPPRCRYGVFSQVLVLAAFPLFSEQSSYHAAHGFQGPEHGTAFLRVHQPCIWIGAFRGGWCHLGAAGRTGQGQLGTTHCEGGRVRGRGCLGRRRQ